ncbi:MAG TPA: FAD-dependent oxidoreductase, partial [Acidimicrobiales bacterium]|nr:FAD-dependent oxidoreductase [Acidimicrobiales bacterium]
MADEFDIVVIGGGPAGYATALYAGAAGLSVGLIEKDKVGGTCLHRGCIPAKEFLETANVARTVRSAGDYGIDTGAMSVTFSKSARRKEQVVGQLHAGLQGLLKKRKVVTYAGIGSLGSDRVVTVRAEDGTTTSLTGKWIVLAAGSVPRTIPGFDIDGRFILTSDEVLSLEKLPASAVVIGGGAIGCEFASMMADLGTQVTILEALPGILPGCDKEVADVVSRAFTKKGIQVRTGVQVHGHTPKGGVRTVVSFGDGEEVTVEAVVVSVGRRPLSEGLLGPDSGIELSAQGFVKVDEWMGTNVPGVFALGDLVDSPQLAHVGFAEAILAVKTMLGEQASPIDYGKVPWCIYCNPEVAFAGLSEQAAVSAGYSVVTHKTRFS